MEENPTPSFTFEQRDKAQGCFGNCGTTLGALIVLGVIIGVLSLVALGPIGPGNGGPSTFWVQQCRQIGLAMYAYSVDNVDHDNLSPDGTSSTEVFQKLMDGGYVTDPRLFYIPMPGKRPADEGQKLKPENVCFDVTDGVGPNDSGDLPLVFLTGFRVTYAPGTAATPVIRPFPRYGASDSWFRASEKTYGRVPGMGVFYKGQNAVWIRAPDNVVHNFVPANFDAKGKTFRQLTPDGVLPP